MNKSRWLGNEIGQTVVINCPACGSHYLNVDPHKLYDKSKGKKMPCWQFNSDMKSPTFSPSLLVKTGKYVNPKWVDTDGLGSTICHSFIKNGTIQFLGDCTHQFANMTLELLDVNEPQSYS